MLGAEEANLYLLFQRLPSYSPLTVLYFLVAFFE
jgi:hypothetical protein